MLTASQEQYAATKGRAKDADGLNAGYFCVAVRLWNEIYEATALFVGESDDLTPAEYYELAKETWGPCS